jgi:hypothetical protein
MTMSGFHGCRAYDAPRVSCAYRAWTVLRPFFASWPACRRRGNGRCPAKTTRLELLGADAAHAATQEAVAAIDQAAEINDDPAVAKVLTKAAVKGDQAGSRVSWLRALIRRRFASYRAR